MRCGLLFSFIFLGISVKAQGLSQYALAVQAYKAVKPISALEFRDCDCMFKTLDANKGKCVVLLRTVTNQDVRYRASPEVASIFTLRNHYVKPVVDDLTVLVLDGEIIRVEDSFGTVMVKKIDFSR